MIALIHVQASRAKEKQEYLGDWVSTLSHGRAALKLLTMFYTPQTVMSQELSRKMLTWYIRFDLVAGMMSGQGTFLGREWYDARYQHYVKACQEDPNDITLLYNERFAYNGLICADAATLWAQRHKGIMDSDEFWAKSQQMENIINNWENEINPLLTDPTKLVKDFSGAPPRNEDDIVDPYEPNFMYGEPLWRTNLLLLDLWAFSMMYKHQLCTSRGEQPPEELIAIAMKMLQMFEAIHLNPNKPPGIILCVHSSIGVAGLFVPKDEKHSMWIRRKFASVEALGYVTRFHQNPFLNALLTFRTHSYTYSKTFREKMGTHFDVDLRHWWLPHNEGFPRILRTIRKLILDRDEGPPRDQISEDLREMRGIFFSLSIDANARSPSTSTTSTTSTEGRKGKERVSEVHDVKTESASTMQSMDEKMGMDWPVTDDTFVYDKSPDLDWTYDTQAHDNSSMNQGYGI